MARYIIAYVCPDLDQRDQSWVLGAIASDDDGFAVMANPQLDVPAVAAATELSEQSLRNWARTTTNFIANRRASLYDEALQKYVALPPTDPRFLDALIADSMAEVNYHYSKVQEREGPAAEVARQMAGGG